MILLPIPYSLKNNKNEEYITQYNVRPRPSQLMRGPNRTLLVNPDYTIMILDPRGHQVVQAGVGLSPA
jgi:hypothetical protein